jgi:hypothetical protein
MVFHATFFFSYFIILLNFIKGYNSYTPIVFSFFKKINNFSKKIKVSNKEVPKFCFLQKGILV